MKTLRFFLVAAFVAGFGFSVVAQTTIKDLIDSGAYYEQPNYMWYDFKVSASDPLDKVYSGYTVNSTDNSKVNGWLVGWPANDAGVTVNWDKTAGTLVADKSAVLNDNGFASRTLKIGTPQLNYNTKAYPFIAIKFRTLPTCGVGGFQDADETKEKIYGGTRLHVVERAATAVNGANSDFWLRIPRNQADADDMFSRKGDDVNNWLTVYSPNEQDTIHIFNLKGAVMRNHAGGAISENTAAVIDFYLMSIDMLSETGTLEVEWIRSFNYAEDAQEYADQLYASTSVKTVNELKANIYSAKGKIIVDGVINPTIEVFNFQGQSLLKEIGNEISVAAGNYIVKVTLNGATKASKLIVK